jgi:hypothetical protein
MGAEGARKPPISVGLGLCRAGNMPDAKASEVIAKMRQRVSTRIQRDF